MTCFDKHKNEIGAPTFISVVCAYMKDSFVLNRTFNLFLLTSFFCCTYWAFIYIPLIAGQIVKQKFPN
jgi:hypothetical protein